MRGHLEIINPIQLIECVDRELSKTIKIHEDGACVFSELVINPEKIPPEVNLFRIKEWPYATFISDGLVNHLVGKGLTGLALARTQDISPSLH